MGDGDSLDDAFLELVLEEFLDSFLESSLFELSL
jgi:hypothetical protein